ncbi:MAG: DUF7718 family protein [Candidatus Saccharibacteria bacterium]
MPEKRYIIPLSDIDRMIIRQDRIGHDVLAFSVQLEVLINSRWRKAMRFDSADGHPHRHVFYPNEVEYRENMAVEDNNEAFTQAQIIVKKSFQEIHERYKLILERM